MSVVNLSAPNLTQFPPRSPRVRLGGYAHLPRLLDKARARAAGTLGEFHYNCPIDQRFFAFTGIDSEAFAAEVALGRTDSEMLAWVAERAKKLPHEIASWSAWFATLAPGGDDGHAFVGGRITALAKDREDICTWFDFLDLDDYVSYGGRG